MPHGARTDSSRLHLGINVHHLQERKEIIEFLDAIGKTRPMRYVRKVRHDMARGDARHAARVCPGGSGAHCCRPFKAAVCCINFAIALAKAGGGLHPNELLAVLLPPVATHHTQYVAAKGLGPSDPREFKAMLYQMW